jgi:hypothetical protein
MTGSIIKIKRSSTTAEPTLQVGELAYSWGTGTFDNGGERLYFGKLVGQGIVPSVIGGAYFTQMLDHERGKLTASSAIIVDANKKVDQLKTTNITIGGDTTTNDIATDGLLRLNPSNNYVYIGSMYSLPITSPASSGYVLTAGANGTSTWSPPSSTLYVQGDEGDNISVDLLNETFEIIGNVDQGVYTTGYSGSIGPGYLGSGNNIVIGVRDAGYNGSKGVSSYNGSDFIVENGNVSLDGSVPRFFTSNDTGYIGSNGARTVNGEIKIKGSSQNGIKTTVYEGDTILISGEIPSASQRGTAAFSDTYFYVGSINGVVSAKIATNTDVGVAKFPTSTFETVGADGSVTILKATISQRGTASFNTTHFTVDENANVSAKSIYLGTTELVLGETSGMNDVVTGITSIEVGKLKLSDGVIEGRGSDTDVYIELKPKGTGGVKIWTDEQVRGTYTLPTLLGTKDYVLTYKEDNTTEWKPASSKLTIKDTSATTIDVDLLTKGIEFAGDSLKGITASLSGYTGSYPGVKISANYSGYSGSTAGTTNVGVSSFYSDTFVVDALGGVDVKTGGIKNTQLANSKVTVGTTDISLGGSSTAIAGLTTIGFVGSLSINGYDGSYSKITSPQSIHLVSTGSGDYQGYVKIGTEAWALPNSKGNADQVLTSDGSGSSTWASVPRVQFVNTDGSDDISGYVGSFKIGTDVLNIIGDGTIFTDYTGSSGGSNNTIHIGVDVATAIRRGVAKFKTADFVVVDGEVETVGEVLKSISANTGSGIPYGHDLKVYGYVGSGAFSGAIQTVGYGGSNSGNSSGGKMDIVARLATDTLSGVASFNSQHFYIGSTTGATSGGVSAKNFYIGSTSFNLGQAPTTVIGGLTDVTIGDLRIYNTNKIQNVDSNNVDADIILSPKGLGVVNVDNSRISGVASPQADNDAVNKLYADALASGLDVKISVRAATNDPLYGTYTPGFGFTGSAANYGTLTNSGTKVALTVDGVEVVQGDRVLVKDQGIVTVNGTKVAGTSETLVDAVSITNNEIKFVAGTVITAKKGTKWKTPVGFSGVTGLAANTTYYLAADVTASLKITLASSLANALLGNALTISGTPGGTLLATIGDADEAKGNGIYVVSTVGDGSTNWVLTRSSDADQSPGDVNAGMFTFVEEGLTWNDAGFILITDNPITVGVTALLFTQFSSAGRILAGDGLEKLGDNINIVASPTSGITVNADSIEISSTIAGNALNFTNGVLGVNFDNTTIGYTGSVSKQLRIHENYTGQGSISYVGSITSGTWKATAIAATYGGTGLTSIPAASILYSPTADTLAARTATGTDKYKFLMIDGSGGANDGMPIWSDIDGGEY